MGWELQLGETVFDLVLIVRGRLRDTQRERERYKGQGQYLKCFSSRLFHLSSTLLNETRLQNTTAKI